MPEGDTIYRAAQTLSKAIGGRLVLRFRSSLPALSAAAPRLEGRRIERVEAHGKNLLIHFDEGTALHTHMRMTGSWHIYRPGERWQKPERAARVVIETDAFVAVCFNAPVVDLIRAADMDHHRTLGRLGPDVLKDDFDADLARRRLRARPGVPIAAALLDQEALAGIGNIYKSEALFLCRVDPLLPVSELPDDVLDRLIHTSRDLMSRNLDGHPRATRGLPSFRPLQGPRYWVYGRTGKACLQCGALVRARRDITADRIPPPRSGPPAFAGVAGRTTYWCPACQPPGSKGAGLPPEVETPPAKPSSPRSTRQLTDPRPAHGEQSSPATRRTRRPPRRPSGSRPG